MVLIKRVNIRTCFHIYDGIDYSIVQIIHPSVQIGTLLAVPGFLDDGGLWPG